MTDRIRAAAAKRASFKKSISEAAKRLTAEREAAATAASRRPGASSSSRGSDTS